MNCTRTRTRTRTHTRARARTHTHTRVVEHELKRALSLSLSLSLSHDPVRTLRMQTPRRWYMKSRHRPAHADAHARADAHADATPLARQERPCCGSSQTLRRQYIKSRLAAALRRRYAASTSRAAMLRLFADATPPVHQERPCCGSSQTLRRQYIKSGLAAAHADAASLAGPRSSRRHHSRRRHSRQGVGHAATAGGGCGTTRFTPPQPPGRAYAGPARRAWRVGLPPYRREAALTTVTTALITLQW
jgi:hypothetical protein